MKKALLFTLAALCVSAAQALTTDWTVDVEKASAAGSTATHHGEGVWGNRSCTISAAITYGSEIGTGAVLSFAQTMYTNNNYTISINDGNYVLSVNGTAQTSSQTIAATANAGQVVTIALYRTASTATSPNYVTLEASINGVVFATYSGTNTGSWENLHWGRQATSDDVGTNAYTGKATYSVYSQFAAGESAKIDATTAYNEIKTLSGVPEPTALALLALGVAGLALKRKVA